MNTLAIVLLLSGISCIISTNKLKTLQDDVQKAL